MVWQAGLGGACIWLAKLWYGEQGSGMCRYPVLIREILKIWRNSFAHWAAFNLS